MLAASGDTHEPVVEAQTALAFLYSRHSSTFHNLRKALSWHNQASRYGSLESLGMRIYFENILTRNSYIIGAVGAMNLFGIGTNKDTSRAIECLRQASERGNIYVSESITQQIVQPYFLGYGSSGLCILYEKTIYKSNGFSEKVIGRKKY